MVITVFILICLLGSGFLAVFFVELCREDGRHRKCHVTRIENLMGSNYELDLDRPHAHSRPIAAQANITSIEEYKLENESLKQIGTGTSGSTN